MSVRPLTAAQQACTHRGGLSASQGSFPMAGVALQRHLRCTMDPHPPCGVVGELVERGDHPLHSGTVTYTGPVRPMPNVEWYPGGGASMYCAWPILYLARRGRGRVRSGIARCEVAAARTCLPARRGTGRGCPRCCRALRGSSWRSWTPSRRGTRLGGAARVGRGGTQRAQHCHAPLPNM